MAPSDGRAALHVVTNDEVLARPDVLEVAMAILLAGGPSVAIHLRGARTPASALFGLAERLAPHVTSAGAALVVNDRVDVALALPADGVHLGSRSLSAGHVRPLLPTGMVLGVSCHSVEDLLETRAAGADYAFFGPVYATASHPGVVGTGAVALADVVRAVPGFPVAAIGGVVPERVEEVVAAGAVAVAAIRGVWDAEDPAGAVHRYISAVNASKGADGSGS